MSDVSQAERCDIAGRLLTLKTSTDYSTYLKALKLVTQIPHDTLEEMSAIVKQSHSGTKDINVRRDCATNSTLSLSPDIPANNA